MNSRFITTGIVSFAILASFVGTAFAQTGDTTVTNSVPTVTPVKDKLNLSCVQGIVYVRESAIMEAFSVFAISQSKALEARREALNKAWIISDDVERRAVRKQAWADYKVAAATAWSTLRTSRKEAWANFKTVSKTECLVPVVEYASGSMTL
jgi:hypothetical protein